LRSLRNGTWAITALLATAACINYADRSSLSIAAPALSRELALGDVQLGLLLSTFFWTYTICQSISGWLTDRYPVRSMFAIGFLVWSVATLGCGLAPGLIGLALFRLLLGAGESVAFPCYSKIIAARFPIERRGVPNSLIEAGTKLGPAVGTLAGGLVMARFGWRSMFLVLGSAGLFWLIPWMRVAPRPTADNARQGPSPSIAQILRRRDAWGTFIGNFCYQYGYYFLLTWLPTYLVRERHVSIESMSILASLPFWIAAVSAVVCGALADRLIRRGASPSRVRKGFVAGGLLLSTVMVPAAITPNLSTSVALLCLSYAAFGMAASNHWAISQTLAGTAAAGTWTGIKNTIGNLAGIIAPVSTGWLVHATGGFLAAFISPAIIAVVGACAWALLVKEVAPIHWEGDYARQSQFSAGLST
jgi:ACS family D-galactonate transporter-like MFS transporter